MLATVRDTKEASSSLLSAEEREQVLKAAEQAFMNTDGAQGGFISKDAAWDLINEGDIIEGADD